MSAYRVLVGDHNPDLLSLVETRLQVRDYEVVLAHEASEALCLAQRIRFDLVLIGASMERGDGGHLCKRIKHASANFSVPVILMTEDENLRPLVLSPERGFDDFLIKPFDAFSLQLRVELNLVRHEVEGISRAIERYREDVVKGKFPSLKESFK